MLRDIIHRHGARRVTIVITLVSMAASSGVTVVAQAIAGFSHFLFGAVIAAAIPMVALPVTLYAFLRLLDQLDRAEERSRESESRYRALFENAFAGIGIADTEERLVMANPRLAEMLEYSQEELRGMSLSQLTSPEEFARYRELTNRRKAGSRDRYETHMLTNSGSTIRVEVLASPLTDREGALTGVMAVVDDITAHREMEEEKATLEEGLRQSQKMESVGRLTAGIAHNFNNMVQAILGALELSLLEVPESLRPNLATALEAAVRSSDIVRQLTLFSHPKAGGEKQLVDLRSIVDSATDICRKTFDKRISLDVMTPSPLPSVYGVPSLLEQMLMNLLLNARDAIEEVGNRPKTIRIYVDMTDGGESHRPKRTAHDYVRVRVSDDGIGMDDETRKRIFEPFFTTKEIGSGTGLGLFTVYGIVEQHEGWIDCDSKSGQGTTFSVCLPVAGTPSGVPEPPVPAIGVDGEETILLIEDEEAVRTVTAQMLESCGYHVLLGIDGIDGLDVYDRHAGEIDLVLLDMSMPRMTGSEVLEELRAREADVKIVLFSGYPTEGERFEGEMVIHKPVKRDMLARYVREFLDA